MVLMTNLEMFFDVRALAKRASQQVIISKNSNKGREQGSGWLPERINDGPVPIHRDGRQREDRHVHADQLHERAERAHKLGQIPALEQGRLELERDGEHANGDVGQRQIGDEHVRDRLHLLGGEDDPDDERVAYHRQYADGAVKQGQQHQQANRDFVQIFCGTATRG